jgi:hypothetical protein
MTLDEELQLLLAKARHPAGKATPDLTGSQYRAGEPPPAQPPPAGDLAAGPLRTGSPARPTMRQPGRARR